MTAIPSTLDLPRTEDATPAERTAPPRRPLPKVDESKLVAAYANFCRVTGTPEELILDFGLNAQPFAAGEEPVAVTQRIVTNFFTAKRMLQALQLAVSRHESAFGVLETDVQKRVVQPERQARG